MRTTRTIRSSKELREIIENDKRFVPVNNRIFDDLYMKEELPYYPYLDETEDYKDKLCENKDKKFRMTELDFIITIFLQLLNYNKVAMYPEEVAAYLGCSKKAFYNSVRKLERIKGIVLTKPIHTQDHKKVSEREYIFVPATKREYDEHDVRVLTEKQYNAFIPLGNGKVKRQKMDEWYINFDTDWQDHTIKKQLKWKRVNFFFVTIKDFDLLTNGLMSRTEFVLYLYLIRRDSRDERRFYLRNSTIANDLRIKHEDSLIKYLDNLIGSGYVEVYFPKKYDDDLRKFNEPSREFKPVYNYRALDEYMQRLAESGDFDTLEEVNYHYTEVNNDKEEDDFFN